jgi:hypothetical protein
MAARVTSDEVRTLVYEMDDDVDLTLFISVATNLVDEELATLDPALGDLRLHDIELFLAAHFATVSYSRIAQEGVSSASERVQFAVGLNFNVTVFGQQALVLDTSGTLAKLQKKAKSGGYSGTGVIGWLGVTEEEHDEIFGTEEEE